MRCRNTNYDQRTDAEIAAAETVVAGSSTSSSEFCGNNRGNNSACRRSFSSSCNHLPSVILQNTSDSLQLQFDRTGNNSATASGNELQQKSQAKRRNYLFKHAFTDSIRRKHELKCSTSPASHCESYCSAGSITKTVSQNMSPKFTAKLKHSFQELCHHNSTPNSSACAANKQQQKQVNVICVTSLDQQCEAVTAASVSSTSLKQRLCKSFNDWTSSERLKLWKSRLQSGHHNKSSRKHQKGEESLDIHNSQNNLNHQLQQQPFAVAVVGNDFEYAASNCNRKQQEEADNVEYRRELVPGRFETSCESNLYQQQQQQQHATSPLRYTSPVSFKQHHNYSSSSYNKSVLADVSNKFQQPQQRSITAGTAVVASKNATYDLAVGSYEPKPNAPAGAKFGAAHALQLSVAKNNKQNNHFSEQLQPSTANHSFSTASAFAAASALVDFDCNRNNNYSQAAAAALYGSSRSLNATEVLLRNQRFRNHQEEPDSKSDDEGQRLRAAGIGVQPLTVAAIPQQTRRLPLSLSGNFRSGELDKDLQLKILQNNPELLQNMQTISCSSDEMLKRIQEIYLKNNSSNDEKIYEEIDFYREREPSQFISPPVTITPIGGVPYGKDGKVVRPVPCRPAITSGDKICFENVSGRSSIGPTRNGYCYQMPSGSNHDDLEPFSAAKLFGTSERNWDQLHRSTTGGRTQLTDSKGHRLRLADSNFNKTAPSFGAFDGSPSSRRRIPNGPQHCSPSIQRRPLPAPNFAANNNQSSSDWSRSLGNAEATLNNGLNVLRRLASNQQFPEDEDDYDVPINTNSNWDSHRTAAAREARRTTSSSQKSRLVENTNRYPPTSLTNHVSAEQRSLVCNNTASHFHNNGVTDNRHNTTQSCGTSGSTVSRSSRNSSGIQVTPSPSDSGVAEFESILHEKESELASLRQAMEQNEHVIVQVYQEKEEKWIEKLQQYAERLELSSQTEQKLMQQVLQLEDDKSSLQQLVMTLSTEKQGLQKKIRELEQQYFDMKAQMNDKEKHHKDQNCNSRDCHFCTDESSDPMSICANARSSSVTALLDAELNELRQEVSQLRHSLLEQATTFAEERQQWECEKQKVIDYQNLLQQNYADVFQRNATLVQRLQEFGEETENVIDDSTALIAGAASADVDEFCHDFSNKENNDDDDNDEQNRISPSLFESAEDNDTSAAFI